MKVENNLDLKLEGGRMDSDALLYHDSGINDLSITCTDGTLYYSKRSLYIHCLELRQILKPKEVSQLVADTRQIVVLMILRLIDNAFEGDIPGDPEGFAPAYTLCVRWGYAAGVSKFSEILSDLPTINDLILLKENEDDNYREAVSNFASSFDSEDYESCTVHTPLQVIEIMGDVCRVFQEQHNKLNNFIRFSRDVVRYRSTLYNQSAHEVGAKIDELVTIHLPSFVPITPQNAKKRKRSF
jgi:hypothetical protein